MRNANQLNLCKKRHLSSDSSVSSIGQISWSPSDKIVTPIRQIG